MLEHTQMILCGGESCHQLKSLELKDIIETTLEQKDLSNDVVIYTTGCFGLCERGPILAIYPDEVFYEHVSPDDIEEIIESHIKNHKIVERLMIDDPITQKRLKSFRHFDVFRKQKRIALRNCGVISPLHIDEYIAKDGYFALAKALLDMTPIQVVEEMKASGLRGRGGGGFSTGLKWEFAHKQVNDIKYVICNADEGDPGAFMDRAVLEGDPHSILEAMAICGYAIGAKQGYIYVRAEYPLAIERLNHAIKQAYAYGLLGDHILKTDFDFHIELRLGSGAFVCGEETALIASIEGNRGMPRLKPPFPAVSGLWGKPTNVNNVETFANVPVVIFKGAKWFRTIGTESSPGTKVFALGGKIKNTGLIEVPMGTTLREVIYDIGGGIPNRKKFKAIQTGGPSGGCITSEHLDTPIDFDSLKKLGSMMGSGGMIVMDEDNCMVDVARFYLDFTVDESCGKCTPCREGTKRMLDILERICAGSGTLEDLDKLEELGHMIQETSLCGLGQTAPNPVLSTLKHFRSEYVAHVTHKTCPAGVCRELTNFFINDKCVGCTKCAVNCPVGAITGWPNTIHKLDLSLCIRCGACKQACPTGAIVTTEPILEVQHA
ncbi:MAG: NADH-quinone oxidoreductase subunit NuoF [Acholeplasmataceae bacterium]|jgi:NADH:ubiquinone oxidoreductase subunit F (NADH-binding)/(2Fe-2S) ferredoxin|nr:NADH-quinone oxidoreductase subunit NuoF [Acholeplasmataceae bacterium]